MAPYKFKTIGTLLPDSGLFLDVPSEKSALDLEIMKIANEMATIAFTPKITFDGIRFGTQVRFFPAISKGGKASLVVWNRTRRADYTHTEVSCGKRVPIDKWAPEGSESWSAIMFYSFAQHLDEEPVVFPDLSDASSIRHDMDYDHGHDPLSWWPAPFPPGDDPPSPPRPPSGGVCFPDVDMEAALDPTENVSDLSFPKVSDKDVWMPDQCQSDQSMTDPSMDLSRTSGNDTTIDWKDDSVSRSRSDRGKRTSASKQEKTNLRKSPNEQPKPEPSISPTLPDPPEPNKKSMDISRSREYEPGESSSVSSSSSAPPVQPPVVPQLPIAVDSLPSHDENELSPWQMGDEQPGQSTLEETPLDGSSLEQDTTIDYKDPDSSVGFTTTMPEQFYGLGSPESKTFIGRTKAKTILFNVSDEIPGCDALEAAYYEFRSEIGDCAETHYSSKLEWDKTEAMFVFPGGWTEPHCFWVDLLDGSCFKTQADDNLSEQEIIEHWEEVAKADLKEIQSFVDENVFKLQHYSDAMCLPNDATWVRKWKKVFGAFGRVCSKTVKSRRCGRGFLDPQKDLVPTKSSTATRLSHRVFVSLCVLLQFIQETWDTGNAFLKGLTFEPMEKKYRGLGLEAPTRRVSLRPPANVWHLLQMCVGSKIWINLRDRMLFLLELLKTMYGLNDGLIAFNLCLGDYYCDDLGAHQSRFDENFFFWMSTSRWPEAVASSHVDDNEIGSDQEWLDDTHGCFEGRWGKTKRTSRHMCTQVYGGVRLLLDCVWTRVSSVRRRSRWICRRIDGREGVLLCGRRS